MGSEMRILHVDDEASIRDLTKTFLERQDQQFSVETAPSADKGLEKLTDRPPDCIVSDYDMPGMDGLELLQTVREEYPDLPFILFTGKGSETVASDAIAAGVTDYLQKSGGSEQYDLLANRIRNAVQARREATRAERQEQLMRLTEFAGDTGGFEIDIEAGEVLMTDGAHRLSGLHTNTTLSIDEAIDLYHPEDRADIRQALDRACQTGEQTQGVFRYQHPDGEQRLVDIIFTPSKSDENTPTIRGAIQDITEKSQRQEQLDSERRFINQALDALEDIFYVIDTDGTLRRWNETACNVTGYSDSELDGMLAIETFPEDEHEKISAAVETVLTDGETTVEADLLTADGERLPYEFKGARLTDDDGEPTGLVGVGRDLTDRRQQEQRFQALVEESNDLITIVDADGGFQYQSPSMERLLGYDPENTLGETAWEFVHPDDRANLIEAFERGVADPDANPVTVYRARHADGSWRWMEGRGNNQLDNPAVEGYVINSRDITKRKEREQGLEQYKTLVEALTDPVYVVDEEGRFTHVNDEFVELVGYDRETILGSRPSLIKTDDSVDRADTHLSRVLSSDGPDTVSLEVTIQPCTGEPIICEDHMGVLPYDGEAFEGSVGILRDITEQKEYEQRIEAENERLDEFAGIVSHDLQNPLGVVEARLQLAQKECESDHLQKATDALARSQALIEDLLTLAREGTKVTDLEPVELPAVAEGCWNSVATDQATLEVEQLPVITADRSQVKQLFENLYRNAVEHGGTDVTVSVGAMDDGFYVADTGPGIPESEREAVFEAGYSTNQEGTGFGLRIVEEVADAHGWEVAVTESTQGGARFEMTGAESVN
jgi:PAS domain S-box-containing protein